VWQHVAAQQFHGRLQRVERDPLASNLEQAVDEAEAFVDGPHPVDDLSG
jgi:hypothetical protein